MGERKSVADEFPVVIPGGIPPVDKSDEIFNSPWGMIP